MSEYIAPGIYLEEMQAGATPIEGVPTSTTAFVGRILAPARVVELTSAADVAALLTAPAAPDLFGDALRLFFRNGGKHAWISGVASLDVAAVADGFTRLSSATQVALTAVPEAAVLAGDRHEQIVRVQLADAARMRRFALIDAPVAGGSTAAQRLRAQLDSSFGALYWPALRMTGDSARVVPASAAVCGVYARVDRQRGVFSPPVGEAVAGIAGLADAASASELAALDAAGINALRGAPGAAARLTNARTLSSSPDLRYVAVRRTLLMLQNAISRGTRWAAFEANDARLWSELRLRIGEFLRWQFLDGALQGTTADEAFYVRCDESTTSVDERAAGIVVCLIGVALLRAGEYFTFRVAQSTRRGSP
jgi:phage tail sheath protein FI